MDVDEYVMHKVVAHRLREARAAPAGRAMLGSRAALDERVGGVPVLTRNYGERISGSLADDP